MAPAKVDEDASPARKTPTPQQLDYYAAVANGTEHLAVSAVAGSSKTSSSVEAARSAGEDVGFVAFGKTIATELQERLGSAAQAMTLHSLGLRLLLKACTSMDGKPDPRKVTRHAEQLYPEFFREGTGKWAGRTFLKDEFEALPEVVAIMKQQTTGRQVEGWTRHIIRCCQRQGIELPSDPEEIMEAAQEVYRETLEDRTAVDFNDMVAMPVFLGLVKPQFRTLFVDEAQDLNAVQHALALGSGERFVVVGDPHQAIMGFAGADESSFDTLAGHLGALPAGCRQLPLTVSFRCPAAHGELARLLVPHFECREGAPDGVLADVPPSQLEKDAAPGDMVICRNNAPVVGLAYRLIQLGKPVMVRGRAIGDGLTSLVRKLKPLSVEELASKTRRWAERQIAKLQAQDADATSIQAVQDRAACLLHLAQSEDDIPSVLDLIDRLFSDASPDGKICLSSVHRSKGLESGRVWIYEPGLMAADGGQQALNLLYVALTRSKQELYLVDDTVHRKHATPEWVRRVAGGSRRRELTEETNDV